MVLEISFGPLTPALAELIAGAVLFLAVWFVIAKYVAPRFEQTYAERSALIAGGIAKAEAAQEEAAAALAQYKDQLAGAREEASNIREDAKAQGAGIVAEARKQAQEESGRIVAQAHNQIEADRTQAVQRLHGEIGGLATSLAGRIVGESLDDDERASRTVERFIADLEGQQTAKSGAGQGA